MTSTDDLYRDDLAEVHVAGYGFHWEGAAPVILEWLRQHGLHDGLMVDLGCGGGQWLATVADAGYETVGIDVSAAMIQRAKRNSPTTKFICESFADADGGVVNEGTIFPVRTKSPKQGYVYQVPYRSILPKPEECTNLLVPVALSCTHVGISSLRVEPTWMILGQSAGIAAAMTAKDERQRSVQQLPYAKLRERLLAQGQVLELPDQGGAKTLD